MKLSDLLFWSDSVVLAAFGCMVIQYFGGYDPMWVLI